MADEKRKKGINWGTLAIVGAGAYFGYKSVSHDDELDFVGTRLDRAESDIEDIKTTLIPVTDYITSQKTIYQGRLAECYPYDFTCKVGSLYVKDEYADFRFFAKFKNINTKIPLRCTIKAVTVKVGGVDVPLPKHSGNVATYLLGNIFSIVVQPGEETGWKLIRDVVSSEYRLLRGTNNVLGSYAKELYGTGRNNRRGHFYPATAYILYTVNTNETEEFGETGTGIAMIHCELWEDAELSSNSWNEQLLSNDIFHHWGYSHPKEGPTNAELINDYRNEILWNDAFKYGNWFRTSRPNPAPRYPHYNQIHPDFNNGVPKATYKYAADKDVDITELFGDDVFDY